MPIPVPGQIAEALRRSTVQVCSGTGRQQGRGSAVVLHDEQLITNAHVLAGSDLTVETWEGKTIPAKVIRLDRRRDLALLVAPGLRAAAAQLGDSQQLKVGAPLVAVGNPLGFVGAVSTGVVHSLGTFGGFGNMPWIQADIRLAPGNSGGPLANWQGQVVGINTMIASGGLALAIPSRAVQLFLEGKPLRHLGVTAQPVRLKDGGTGMLVLEVASGTAAEAASLLCGDVLVAAGGRRLHSPSDLQAGIDGAAGALLALEFYRGNQSILRRVVVQLVPEPVRSAA